MNREVLLQVQGLSIGLSDGQPLLRDVSFSVHRGETFSLLGESGCGKTLSALSIVRLLPPAISFYDGSIRFGGTELLQLSEAQMESVRGGRISFVFQEPATALNPVFTVAQQIVEALRLTKNARSGIEQDKVEYLLEEVGIDDPRRVAQSYPHELSGGMKQRVVIAIAIAGEPQLLIADEPTTALDVTVQAQVLDLLKSLQRRFDMAMLFISHDLAIVAHIADSLAVMRNGQIVEFSENASFRHLTHPYSRSLLQALPSIGEHVNVSDGHDQAPSARHDSPQNILEVKNLSVRFPVRSGVLRRVTSYITAVDNVSFTLEKGKTMALVGESGSGKTTVAKAVLKLLDNHSGTILFQGQQLDALSRKALHQFRRKVQVILQDPFSSMNPKLTIGEIVQEGMRAQGLYEDEAATQQKTFELLHKVGLTSGILQRYPHEFSGGQRQRLCIARALAVEPELLICDEPTSSLDVSIQTQILDLLWQLQQEQGLSYLFITHDIGVVARMAHVVVVMCKGRVVESGAAAAVLNRPVETYTRTLLASVPRLDTGIIM